MDNMILDFEIDEAEEFIKSEVGEGFRVDSVNAANWCLRKIRAYESKKAEAEKLYDNEMARIQYWKDREFNRMDSSIEFFKGMLTAYYIKEKAGDEKFRLSTPYGKVYSRKNPDKVIFNEDEVIDWLRERNKFRFIKMEVRKADLKKELKFSNGKAYDENGEEVEGVFMESGEENIIIDVK